MQWEVEYTDQFEEWWNALDEETQEDIDAIVRGSGPALTRPYADAVQGSRYPNMRELRIQSRGRPLRILCAFDPRRTAILLVGGDKTGLTDEQFYATYVPMADRLFGEHIEEIIREE